MIRFKKSKKILAAILTAGMLLAGNGVPICAAEPVSVAQTEVYDYSQAGENYMTSYSENGVSRHWRDRDSLFVGVYPFVKAL